MDFIKMEGFATMYMRMPMSTSTLPIQGKCTMQERKINLKFPFTGIEFELPRIPDEGCNDFDFKIRGASGDMLMTIGYVKELKCFTGVGKQDDDTQVLSFCFFTERSPMANLNMLHA